MAGLRPRYAIILAGGKGTRMRSADRHKVCFPIDGRPAINRAIDVYRSCGIRHPIVVVGAMAAQVMATIAQEHEGVIYAYQAEQLGTGHAARLGAQVLEALDSDEDVLLVAGDRMIEPIALERLMETYYADGCDMAFMVLPRTPRSRQGRVLVNDDGTVLAVVEMRDIRQREGFRRIRHLAHAQGPPCRERALEVLREGLTDRQASLAFGALWERLADQESEPTAEELLSLAPEDRTRFTFSTPDGETVSLLPREVEAAPLVNVSVYLGKSSALTYALGALDRDNAQQEEYLPDIVNILARTPGPDGQPHVIRAVRIDDPNHVMGFNNPAELLAIEEYYRGKKRARRPPEMSPSSGYRTVGEWLAALGETSGDGGLDPQIEKELGATYGEHPQLLDERRQAYRDLLAHAKRVLGEDTSVFLVRAPGRVNILGRHIDHQGGNCNLMAIDREILMAVHPRADDVVMLHNMEDGEFASCQFVIGDLLAKLPWDDWLSLVNSEQLLKVLGDSQGDWSHYVQAAVLRLQKRFPTTRLRGMDIVVHGNIPIAAGLSSSSALVVAAAEATVTANDLEILPSQFVDLCGEGEWYVGTRGGSADHAAMKFGQRGKVAKVRFFPFGVEEMVDFPADYCLVICNSMIQARKAAGARDIFNHRIACYRLGRMLIKERYRQFAPLIEHLRDVNVRNLGVPLTWIYRILLSLPERASREELEQMLPTQDLTPIFATHAPPQEGYPVRGVVFFGLAECERSRAGVRLLAEGKLAQFGRLMQVSHNGDRISLHDIDGTERPYRAPTSNGYILDLITSLETGDPDAVLAAQLQWQPGAYRCSTPEIDLMVDLAMTVSGVAGAQLAGAGLGGCMMVLGHRDSVDDLTRCLDQGYYARRGLTPAVSACTPIAGSGAMLNPRGACA